MQASRAAAFLDGMCVAAVSRTVTSNIRCRGVSTNYIVVRASSSKRVALAPSVHQTLAGRQRFYKQVQVVAVSADEAKNSGLTHLAGANQADNQFYGITLDGRRLKTPAMAPMLFPNQQLAAAVALEWDAQIDKRRGIQPSNMPLMTLAATAIDQIFVNSEESIGTCMNFLPTDTALFLTSSEDRILLSQQKEHFSPVLRWLRRSLRVDLSTTESISGRIQHPMESVALIESVLRKMDPFTLSCMQSATMECKSIILALAFIARRMSLADVKVASRLEEEFQLDIWGVVEGGHDMDRLNNSVRLSSVDVFMALLRDHSQHQREWLVWTTDSSV